MDQRRIFLKLENDQAVRYSMQRRITSQDTHLFPARRPGDRVLQERLNSAWRTHRVNRLGSLLNNLLRLTIVIAVFGGRAAADGPDAVGLAEFESDVRPLLVQHCLECHGPRKSESGLRLDARDMLLKGGDRGPAISTKQPGQSLIVQAMRHIDGLEMPPLPSEQLTEHEITAVERWIAKGATWPDGVTLGGTGPQLRSGRITTAERSFWSFQPLTDPRPPQLDDLTPVSAIDRFLMRKLRDANLTPMPPATRRVLIRRATFDLTGLPPTPNEVQAFLEDCSADAWVRVIDRLLASRAYGERWGRHWLDVVRYADTAGETADYPTPLAYKYRNWVIDAFNADMPYDQFVRQQIAGDILADQLVAAAQQEPRDDELSQPLLARYASMRTATGFIAISRRFGFDVENYHHLTIQDTIDVIGQSMLGLTLGFARCHDHKYDPVNAEDYYAWYGIFESTRYSFPGSEEKKRPYDLFPDVPTRLANRRKADFDARFTALNTQITRRESEIDAESQRLDAAEHESTGPEKTSSDPTVTPFELTKVQDAIAFAKHELERLVAERDLLVKKGPYEVVYGAVEQDAPHDSRIQLRGERNRFGDEVPRRNLEILGGDALPPDAGSGRLQLADWLTREENPLLARVMVNRIWQQHFGRGLVSTSNDFGMRGERPSHPELLDWLASRFRASDYSVKSMHRLIMNTAAYQRASDYNATAVVRDPDARLLWRFNRRRLSAEEIRDAMLFVSGNLDRSMGGEHDFPAVETWGFTQHNPFYGVYPTNRRSVYLMQQRLRRHPFLGLFDGADTSASTSRRELTTVPTQALFLMNNPFVYEQAAAFANRVFALTEDDSQFIERAYQIAFGRPATTDECDEVRSFLTAYREAAIDMHLLAADRDRIAREALARTLLTRNEFLFVD